MRYNPVNNKVREEGGGGGVLGTGAEISLQTVEEATVEQIFLCSQWRGSCQSRFPHCSPWRMPNWYRFILKDYSLWKEPTGEKCEEKGAAERNFYGLAS